MDVSNNPLVGFVQKGRQVHRKRGVSVKGLRLRAQGLYLFVHVDVDVTQDSVRFRSGEKQK
jgi:hypothetical protein